jgi:hypothetical protein
MLRPRFGRLTALDVFDAVHCVIPQSCREGVAGCSLLPGASGEFVGEKVNSYEKACWRRELIVAPGDGVMKVLKFRAWMA